MGFPIPTPGTLQDLARKLDADVDTLHAFALSKSANLTGWPSASWANFWGRWKAWFWNHEQVPAAIGYIPYGNLATVIVDLDRYRKEFDTFSRTARELWPDDAPTFGEWPDLPTPSSVGTGAGIVVAIGAALAIGYLWLTGGRK